MISLNQKKQIRSLHQKKYRSIHHLFLAEGRKIVKDLIVAGKINRDNLHLLVGSADWFQENTAVIEAFKEATVEASLEDLAKISSLMTPPDVIAVLKIQETDFKEEMMLEDYTLVLDTIRDPGNFGTIIRTANWFGIPNIICSDDSVDLYNTKVVQASMGSVMNVNVFYHPLEKFLKRTVALNLPVYGTTLNGKNLYDIPLQKPGILIFGNESTGISPSLVQYFTESVFIPGGRHSGSGVESLNVASAVSAVISECRRRDFPAIRSGN